MRTTILSLILCFCFLLTTSSPAKADLTFMLHEGIGTSAELNAAGHSTVYFSNFCSASKDKLRFCNPGEEGVVLVLYDDFGAKEKFHWMAIPYTAYLHGFDKEENAVIYANGKIRKMIRESYRAKHWNDVIDAPVNGVLKQGQWQSTVGVLTNRDVYTYKIKTSLEQDAAFLEAFNAIPNVNKFSTMFNNCSDFAANLLNFYFNGSVKRDPLNDAFFRTPKSVAKTFYKYTSKRPELELTLGKYSQISGPIRRSCDVRHITEEALFSRKYILPLAVWEWPLIVEFSASYFLFGRYSAENTYQKHLAIQGKNPSVNFQTLRSSLVPETRKDATAPLITAEGKWKEYREVIDRMVARAISNGYFADQEEVKFFYRDLEFQSEPEVLENGSMLLNVKSYGKDVKLGISRNNFNSDISDKTLLYKLMLVRLQTEAHATPRNRRGLEEFEPDWQLLRDLAQEHVKPNEYAALASKDRPRFLTTKIVTPFSKKFKLWFAKVSH